MTLEGGLIMPVRYVHIQASSLHATSLTPSSLFSGTQTSIADSLIKAFTQIATDAKKAGYTTIGGTIMPFGGNSYQGAEREKARKKVNKWIMESKVFDHSVDLAGMVADKANPERLDKRYDGGDGLHPNGVGYQAVADGFPIEIFK